MPTMYRNQDREGRSHRSFRGANAMWADVDELAEALGLSRSQLMRATMARTLREARVSEGVRRDLIAWAARTEAPGWGDRAEIDITPA